ncbi:MAG: 30S ribosomal protein S21 [Bdellovibrionaceae bacterium]|nr:30S ribosomal protein S21 [Pseudobdellovibrionaceae bacterium]
MPKVKVSEGDNLEYALRRFKKNCEKLGILSEIKKREAFEKPSLARKKKSLMARKRAFKKTRFFS